MYLRYTLTDEHFHPGKLFPPTPCSDGFLHACSEAALFLLEDLPQLSLQVIYFEAVGLDPKQDALAIVALCFTLLIPDLVA